MAEPNQPATDKSLQDTGTLERPYYDPNKLLGFNLLKSSKFAAVFKTLPSAAAEPEFKLGNVNIREFSFLCDSIEFPGQNLDTTEYRIPGQYKRKVPYQRNLNEVSMTFYHNDDIPLYEIFTKWITGISPSNTENYYFDEITCEIDLIQFLDTNGSRGFFSGFFEDQKTDAQLPKPAKKYMTVRLKSAYPLNFASLPSNWADDGFQKINVSFFFEKLEVIQEDSGLSEKEKQEYDDVYKTNVFG